MRAFAEEIMLQRGRKRERRGRRPVLTADQKKMVHRIVQQEFETAFRRMLGSIGIRYGKRKRQ